MKFKLLIVALLVCCAASAQTTTVTPSQLKAAEDMLIAANAQSQFTSNIGGTLKQASASLPADKRAKFVEVMNSFIAKYISWDLLKDQLAAAYAQEFSEKELKDLAAFYRTPLGIKVNAKQPILMQKGMQLGQQAVQMHQAELQQMLEAAFKDTK